jgi:hypothetical protein
MSKSGAKFVKDTLVYIEWIDSASHHGIWIDRTNLDGNLHVCRSVGWIAAETKDAIALYSSDGYDRHEQTCVGGDITIPKCAIVKRKTLSVEKSQQS